MNIFYLDKNPRRAAEMMHDKHVVKMVLETAQILSTVCHRHGCWVPEMYRPTHARHPSVLWAGDSAAHFYWLVDHGQHLCNEFHYRYSNHHKSLAVIDLCGAEAPVFENTEWTEPPQAMPDEFKIAGDSVAAYRAYYLGRKVEQSGWTRRPVPAFVLEGKPEIMAKKQVKTAPSASTPAAADAPAASSKRGAPIGARGPKGVALDALITLKCEGNPKRPGSKAHAVFAQYADGMTVQAFLDAVGDAATPNLVYDAAHGFIAIEGYDPKMAVKKERAPKEPKAPKAPRAKKAAATAAAPTAAEVEVDALAVEEVID